MTKNLPYFSQTLTDRCYLNFVAAREPRSLLITLVTSCIGDIFQIMCLIVLYDNNWFWVCITISGIYYRCLWPDQNRRSSLSSTNQHLKFDSSTCKFRSMTHYISKMLPFLCPQNGIRGHLVFVLSVCPWLSTLVRNSIVFATMMVHYFFFATMMVHYFFCVYILVDIHIIQTAVYFRLLSDFAHPCVSLKATLKMGFWLLNCSAVDLTVVTV